MFLQVVAWRVAVALVFLALYTRGVTPVGSDRWNSEKILSTWLERERYYFIGVQEKLLELLQATPACMKLARVGTDSSEQMGQLIQKIQKSQKQDHRPAGQRSGILHNKGSGTACTTT